MELKIKKEIKKGFYLNIIKNKKRKGGYNPVLRTEVHEAGLILFNRLIIIFVFSRQQGEYYWNNEKNNG